MPEQTSASNPLMKSALVGVVLQVVLAVLAKYVPGLGGGVGQGAEIGIGGIAGLLFSLWSKGAAMPNAAGGGAVAGGVSGLIGTLAGNLLGGGGLGSGLATGTGYPAIGGVVGGLLGKVLGGKAA
jgi:hypothetical protein